MEQRQEQTGHTTHTPGPWTADAFGLIVNEDAIPVAHVETWGPPENDDGRRAEWDSMEDANARLIAAAPDLLEAAESVLARWDQYRSGPGPMEDLRAAIQKATGVTA